MEWFETRHTGNETWAIDDHGCDVMYLIRGKEKCLLTDTGWGVGDLQTLPLSKGILNELVTGIESIPAGMHACMGRKKRPLPVTGCVVISTRAVLHIDPIACNS